MECKYVADTFTFNPKIVGGSIMLSTAAGDVGGSLGACIANMDKY
jgi:hypothetical protein